ncbi:hypothetical protein D2V08_03370 [Flagellimonas lutimaris]|uniref:Uncharacterized protein n=1 Tax=Flagellimonas lutimaris TaxID=475082 RepID=A0A3A1N9Y2_9FLAO|nr:hypothetical protein D2V08_03370 [Allomuricauda lutimaris]
MYRILVFTKNPIVIVPKEKIFEAGPYFNWTFTAKRVDFTIDFKPVDSLISAVDIEHALKHSFLLSSFGKPRTRIEYSKNSECHIHRSQSVKWK